MATGLLIFFHFIGKERQRRQTTKRNCTIWKRGIGKTFSWKEDHLSLFMFKYIILNPNFHLLPFCLRVTTQLNTSFFTWTNHEPQEQDLPTQIAGKSKAETMIRGHYSDVFRPFYHAAIRNFYLLWLVMSRPYLTFDVFLVNKNA